MKIYENWTRDELLTLVRKQENRIKSLEQFLFEKKETVLKQILNELKLSNNMKIVNNKYHIHSLEAMQSWENVIELNELRGIK